MPRGSRPGERRGGRKLGTPNRVTGALKEMLVLSLAEQGGVEYLNMLAREHPTTYASLLGRLLPIQAQHTGNDGGPLTVIQRLMVRENGRER